jgi:hypothetical protein
MPRGQGRLALAAVQGWGRQARKLDAAGGICHVDRRPRCPSFIGGTRREKNGHLQPYLAGSKDHHLLRIVALQRTFERWDFTEQVKYLYKSVGVAHLSRAVQSTSAVLVRLGRERPGPREKGWAQRKGLGPFPGRNHNSADQS